jgi:integrase
MQNPLIEFKESLKNNKTSPLFSGVLKREAYRAREDIKLAKDALSVIEEHFPKLFHPNPHSYTNFAHYWKLKCFPSLCKKFTSTSQLTKANNLLTHLINEGNKTKVWNLPIPNTIIRQKRERPFRSHKWLGNTKSLMLFEKEWLSGISKKGDDQSNLSDCLISAVLHSGLNEQRHLAALCGLLQSNKPLQRIMQLVWLDLEIIPDRDHKKRSFPFSTNSHSGEDSLLLTRFFPTSITLTLITKYLWNSRNKLTPLLTLQKLLPVVFKQHGMKNISIEQFCKAGIGVAETKTGISIPEAMIEFATKRNMAYSLPNNSWLSLLRAPVPVNFNQKDILTSLVSSNPEHISGIKSDGKKASKFGLLTDLLNLLRDKNKGIKRTTTRARKEWETIFPNLDNLPLNERILLSWIKSKLDKNNKLSTSRRYVNAIGAAWLSGTRDIEISNQNTDFESIYIGMLEFAVSINDESYRAGRLDDLHQFGVVHFQLAPLINPLSDNNNSIPRVRAGFVSEPVFGQVINSISECKYMTELEKIQLCVICIIAYRAGLRIGEILKLRAKDIEWSAKLWLFIRDNQYDNNKSSAARRKIPLITLCTEKEKNFIRQWLNMTKFATVQKSNPQQLFCALPHNRYEMPSKLKISLRIGQLLKQISTVPLLVFYSLRHSAFSRLHLIMHWDTMDISHLPKSLTHAIMPYGQKQRKDVRKTIFGLHPQSRYWALAVAAGHSSPLVTFNNYLHFCDLILFCKLQQNAMPLTKNEAINTSPLSVKTISELTSPGKNLKAFQLMVPVIEKLKNKDFCIEHETSEFLKKPDNAIELELPKKDKSRIFYILHEFLSEYQSGQSTEMLVWQHKLDKTETDRWLANAKLICALSTSKNRFRHNPENRDYSLIPPFPNSHAEKKDIQKLLSHLRGIFKHDKEVARKKLAYLTRVVFLRTHSSNSAIILRHWEHLKKLLDIIDCFPKSRWRIQIGFQHKSTFEEWKKVIKGYTTESFSLTEDKRNPNGQAKLYLSHPSEKQITEANEYDKFSTNVFKLTIRLLSIQVFSEEELNNICTIE